jgi:two-component system cell cycle sensor histidine kinase PleC
MKLRSKLGAGTVVRVSLPRDARQAITKMPAAA